VSHGDFGLVRSLFATEIRNDEVMRKRTPVGSEMKLRFHVLTLLSAKLSAVLVSLLHSSLPHLHSACLPGLTRRFFA